MQKVTRYSVRGLLGRLVAVIMLVGCSAESWNWGSSSKKETPPRPVAKPQTTQPARQARSEAAKPPEPKATNDPEADRVNERIAEYTERMKSGDRSNYDANDINSKIQRQQDPTRRSRIRKVAEDSKTQGGAGAEAPQARPSALTGEATPQPTGEKSPSAPRTPKTDNPPPNDSQTDEKAAVAKPESATPPAKAKIPPDPAKPADDGEPVKKDPRPGAIADKAGESSPPTKAAPAPAEKPAAKIATEKPTKPPVLEDVKVSATPETPKEKEPEKKAEPETPRLVSNAPTPTAPPVDTFKERLRELETRIKKEPNSVDDQYLLRLMYIVSGEPDKAVAPIDGANAEIQDLILAHIRAIQTAQGNTGRDPARSANQQLEKVEELRNLIRSRADLMVPKVVLCTAIEGYGRYTPIETPEFKAAQKNLVLLYIEVDNFRTEQTPSGMFRTLLSVRESLLTKSGEELWSMQDANIEDLARQQRRDFYLTIGPLTIPKTLSPGEYVLKVEVTDVLAEKINSNVTKFKIIP